LRIYNRYIISLVLATSLISTVLAFLAEEDIAIYFTANIIAYLVITMLYVHFNSGVRRALNSIAIVFFAGFLAIVAMKVVEILSV